jgi:hypothetical protein
MQSHCRINGWTPDGILRTTVSSQLPENGRLETLLFPQLYSYYPERDVYAQD